MSTGIEYNYRMGGNPKGRSVVFLHGFMGEGSDWDETLAKLAPEVHYLTLDLPDHGRTVVTGPNGYSMSSCAEALVDLLVAVGFPVCDLVGYSMGGRLALYMVVHFPDRFNGVVLESASPGLKTQEQRRQRQDHDEALARRLQNEPFMHFLDYWHSQPLFASLQRDPKRLAKLIARRARNNPMNLARSLCMMGLGVQPSLWPELSRVRSRLLLIAGELDSKFRQIAGEMARSCPRARMRTVEGAGHNVHFERPGTFANELRSFLVGRS